MIELYWKLKLWLFGNIHSPQYRAGQVVRNRYETGTAKDQILKTDLGPYLGWCEDHWMITEKWLTTDGNEVAVGFFWLPS
jgi:hypothetical protein